jgi:probable HAF family extracellular repeat protein
MRIPPNRSTTWRSRFRVVPLVLLSLSLACSPDLTTPTAGVAKKQVPGLLRSTSALTSTLASTQFNIQYIPGLFRVYAISDSGIVVGDAGGNNIASAWIPGQGTITIGKLDGTTDCCSSLNDINSSGEAIGWSSVSGGTIPMRWSASTNTKFDPGVGGSLFGQGINEVGDIVGGEWPFRAVYKPHGGPAVVLANGAGITGSYAFDLNASGMIVGDAFVGPSMKAVMWTSPSSPAQNLGTFGGSTSRAWQVSDDGDVVGFAQTADGTKHAFLWTQSTGMIDLSTWANSCVGDSEAYAINNNGIIAGRCGGKPVLWTGAQGMIVLPGGNGEATDVNNLNQVVGTTSGGATLWKIAALPPNANVGGPYVGDEGSAVTFDGSASSDPENGALTYAWNFGDGGSSSGLSPSHTYADNGTYTVTLTVTDPTGLTSTASTNAVISNVAPVVLSVVGPSDPLSSGANVAVSGTFSDAGAADTHAVSIDWDANGISTITAGSVTTSGSFTGAHTYADAGVYTVRVTVTDDDNGAGSGSYQYVVVYNPQAGFVTGGGTIDSPAGAYLPIPSAAGRANFGFVSRYEKGKSIPSGQTEFQFKAGGMNFKSSAYEWLVISGRKGQYKGTGKINDAGDYAFMLTCTDGDLQGGDGSDRLRVKIWNRATGQVVYDNQAGALDEANASTIIAGGSIVIHSN